MFPPPEVPPIAQKHVPRYHIWMTDGRSLCDRVSMASLTEADDGTPVCGPCIEVVEILRANAKYLRVVYGDPDETVIQALISLRGTRWDAVDDLENRIANCAKIDAHYPVITERDRNDYRKYHAEIERARRSRESDAAPPEEGSVDGARPVGRGAVPAGTPSDKARRGSRRS